MGWVRHALTQCFVVLSKLAEAEPMQKEGIYQMHIKEVLRLCGDSDTNGAIVGGMIGSYLKLDEFPKEYLIKIVKCDLQKP